MTIFLGKRRQLLWAMRVTRLESFDGTSGGKELGNWEPSVVTGKSHSCRSFLPPKTWPKGPEVQAVGLSDGTTGIDGGQAQ